MNRKRTSLDAIMTRVVEDPTPPVIAVATLKAPREEPPARLTDPSVIVKQTAYLKLAVHEQLRRLAFEERRKQHDYLIEGLDLVFRKRGLPGVAELDKEAK
jgi:hypothetical protein